jgi:NAD(P)-dependent dehydrogenase (short-subunit alcohol dehydrogenase family)
VTGASSGIGEAIAKQLITDGLTVYVAARRVDRMKDLHDLGAIALPMDITKEDEVTAAVETIARNHGGVDVLVNNAGFALMGAMEDTSMDDARYQFEVNLFGLARLTQLVLPSMRAKGFGRIVNLSSLAGRLFMPLGSWYYASKHALEGWSDCLRLELRPFGIHVSIIEPGAILTEFGDVSVGPMVERSGSGPYAEITNGKAAQMRKVYMEGDGSPPSVIAEVVSHAVNAKNPRRRYAAGKYAKLMLLIRRWGGDAVYETFLSKVVEGA